MVIWSEYRVMQHRDDAHRGDAPHLKSELLKSRQKCEFFGFVENHNDESIIIFHGCSTNLHLEWDRNAIRSCKELHVGNVPRSIMTIGWDSCT